MSTRPNHQYITEQQELEALSTALSTKAYVAIDTEFLRERTYRPQLCLIQIKSEELLACVDAQALDDLSPLLAVLENPEITKVLHAASQDLEIFYMLMKKVPAPIFDTQVAAPLLGYSEQIGYGNLVKEHLDIELDKAHTRADWTRRPLSDKQIDYALDDVIYLEQLYLDMHTQLHELGRLSWLDGEFSAATDVAKYDQPAGDRWLKIRNIQRYKGAALSCIQSLAKWREIRARELNQPRNWLIKDDVLCSLAQQQPVSREDLAHIRGLDKKTRERFGKDLVELIASASAETPQPLPPFVKKKKLNTANLARVALLNAWVHQRAVELNIHPSILAPQKVLEKCVTGDCSDALLGWRTALLLEDFQQLLEGSVSLQNHARGLQLAKS